jgi:hypothetical protein
VRVQKNPSDEKNSSELFEFPKGSKEPERREELFRALRIPERFIRTRKTRR